MTETSVRLEVTREGNQIPANILLDPNLAEKLFGQHSGQGLDVKACQLKAIVKKNGEGHIEVSTPDSPMLMKIGFGLVPSKNNTIICLKVDPTKGKGGKRVYLRQGQIAAFTEIFDRAKRVHH